MLRRFALRSIAVAGIGLPTLLGAQTPQVLDVNRDPHPGPGSGPANFVRFGQHVYFTAARADTGVELWRTDGVQAQAALVADVVPGPVGSRPSALTVAGGRLFFVVSGGVLWAFDGTATAPVPGAPAVQWGLSDVLLPFGNGIAFRGRDAMGEELWLSDGTLAGTRRITDIAPGSGSSSPDPLLAHRGFVYFTASEPATGTELWRTDGTSTALVLDALPGTGSGFPSAAIAFGNDILFGTFTGFRPTVWRSDGTPQGTSAIWSKPSIFTRTGPAPFVAFGNRVLFQAGPGLNLWITDGTPGGTVDLGIGPTHDWIAVAGAEALFTAWQNSPGYELWKTDGTPAGTVLVADIWPGTGSSEPSIGVAALGKVFFTADDGASGKELWVSDGTAAGTRRVADVKSGPEGSFPAALWADGSGALLFSAARAGTDQELWRSDGTAAGTRLLHDINPSPPGTQSGSPDNLVDFHGITLFAAADAAHGRELWRSDGTQAGTQLVLDIVPGVASSHPSQLTVVGDTVFFVVGIQLWRTDATVAGTQLLHNSVNPKELTAFADVLLFTGGTAAEGFELWRSDGTAAGTVLLKDIRPGADSAAPQLLTRAGSQVFFSATDGVHGHELWVTDGTTAGTVLVRDVWPGGDGSLVSIAALGGRVLFTPFEPSVGSELWVSDGTAAGTALLFDIDPGPDSGHPYRLTSVRERVFFTATTPQTGRELWVTDGTPAGTRLVRDALPGAGGSNPEELTAFHDRLLYRATDGLGVEPWISDGTAAGTRRLADVDPVGSSLPQSFAAMGNRLAFFGASSWSTVGREPWLTDGTPAGTRLFADLMPGSDGSNPTELTLAGGKLWFAVTDPLAGRELFVADLGATSKPVGGPCAVPGRAPSLWSEDPVLGRVWQVGGFGEPASTFGLLWMAPGRIAPFALAPGCLFHVDPAGLALLAIVPPGGGTGWTFGFPVPNDVLLDGIPLTLQTTFGPTAGPLGIELTNAVHARLGR